MQQINKTLIYRPKIVEGDILGLSDAKKEKIRKVLSSPDFLDILTLANQSKPTANMIGSNPQACSDRLKEISGWEQCEAAILNCLEVLNKKPVGILEEDFNTKAIEL